MKVVILFAFVALAAALPHHHEIENADFVGHNHDHHHHHGHGHGDTSEESHSHEDNHDESKNTHNYYGHHHGKWQKFRTEWKIFREQMRTMTEDMNGLKTSVDEIKEEVQGDKLSMEDAIEELEVDPSKSHMKIYYNTQEKVKLVNGDGEATGVALPMSSAIVRIHSPGIKGSAEAGLWHRIKADTTAYWHHGPAMKLHLVYADGSHEVKLIGNALKQYSDGEEKNNYFVYIPEDAFFTMDFTDNDPEKYTVISYACAPGYTFDRHIKFPMEKTEDGEYSYVPTQEVLDNLKE